MRTVYALQFEVHPLPEQTPEQCFLDLRHRLAEWVEEKYGRAYRKDVRFAFDGKVRKPLPDHEFFGGLRESKDWQYLALEWTHPGDRDDSILWFIQVEAARLHGDLQFSLRIRISSRKPVVKPLVYDLGKPRVVTDIIKQYGCSIDGQPVVRSPVKFGTDQVEAFVDDRLRNRKRLLPVVVLTPDRFTDKPLVNPRQAQDDLVGFATVAVPDSKWTAYAFADHVGRDYACYDGAARVYWPGFEFHANPWDHPLYLQKRILEFQEGRGRFSKYLFETFASIACFRFREGAIVQAVRQKMEAEDQAESDRLRLQVRQGRLETDQMLEELEKTWKTLDESVKEQKRLADRVKELEDEAEQTRNTLAQLHEYKKRREAEGKALTVRSQVPVDFDTVSDALKAAEAEFGAQLVVWDCAKKSAAESGFRRPIEIYRALMAISDLTRKCREAASKRKSTGPWKQYFDQVNLKYAPTESEQTLSKYGSARNFTHKRETRQIVKHLTVGGGSSVDCLQIYFDYDDKKKCMIIAHCGPHLPYASQS